LKLDNLLNAKGQIAVEYILLVSLSASLAVLIVSLLASRNPESPGLIVGKWRSIIEVIATDKIDQ
jgi:hypothetical protein